MSFLTLHGISKRYGDFTAIEQIDLAVERGEFLSLLGPSGCGKTTTLQMIAGFVTPTSGRIELDGRDITRERPEKRGIGVVFQSYALFPHMTVAGNVGFGLEMRKMKREQRAERIAEALELVRLRGLDGRYPKELSGGQRQRVAIAMALAGSPKLILADEPTTALDVTTQAQILGLFRRLAREDGIGVLLITHDIAVVAETADRIAILDSGTIVEEGPALDVLRDPSRAVTKGLVEAFACLPDRRRPAAEVEPILAVTDLSRRYGGGLFGGETVSALKDISFTLAAGESVGVVGESGAGKSTLLRAVLGLERPDAGAITIAGRDLATSRGAERLSLRKRIQAVFQDPIASFDPRHTIGRIVAEPLHLADGAPSRAERRRRTEAVLERVGLPGGTIDRYPHEFSGGQRQRIAIARALIIAPDIIALDEAMSALDAAAKVQLLDLLNGLSREAGISYLFVTHDLSLVRAITDRLIVMKGGRIVETGPTAEVLSAPRNPYTAALVAATPDLPRALAGRFGIHASGI